MLKKGYSVEDILKIRSKKSRRIWDTRSNSDVTSPVSEPFRMQFSYNFIRRQFAIQISFLEYSDNAESLCYSNPSNNDSCPFYHRNFQLRQLLNVMTLERLSNFMQTNPSLNSSETRQECVSSTSSTVDVRERICDTVSNQTTIKFGSCGDLFSCLKCCKIFGTPHGLEVRPSWN